ncbi:DEAD/DEAH box helicase [Candidatus Bathyarchaeota archaeon]|nr:DEAD/DEAH box helicase [Candidatus Bathyarchaeota archaeon]
MEFKDIQIKDEIKKAINDLDFEEMFPIQENAIPPMMEGKNVLGQAKTGTGKTAAFGVPMLQMLDPDSKNVEGLVVAPTRELAQQITDDINSYGKYLKTEATAIYGGVSYNPQINALKRGVTIVVGTPGRLIDLIKKGHLDLRHVKMVALDEADRMFDMGFYDDIEYILRKLPKKRQISLWSATFDERTMILSKQFMPDFVEVNMSRDEISNLDITQYYIVMAHHEKRRTLKEVIEFFDVDRCIIFCRTKYTVDRLASYLKKNNIPAEPIHGDYSQNRRQRVLNGFRDDNFELMIATEVAARGLDIDDVPFIINYDIPDDPNMYFHRIGRTARAGKKGTAITFVLPDQELELERIKAITTTEIEKWSPPPSFLF